MGLRARGTLRVPVSAVWRDLSRALCEPRGRHAQQGSGSERTYAACSSDLTIETGVEIVYCGCMSSALVGKKSKGRAIWLCGGVRGRLRHGWDGLDEERKRKEEELSECA